MIGTLGSYIWIKHKLFNYDKFLNLILSWVLVKKKKSFFFNLVTVSICISYKCKFKSQLFSYIEFSSV